MEKEYNDYQIISPEKMEEIAKKYYEELKPNNYKNDDDIPLEILEQINSAYTQIEYNMKKLYTYCTRRFLYSKIPIIKNIIKDISEIKRKLPSKSFQVKKFSSDYYGCIIFSIDVLLACAKELLEFENHNPHCCTITNGYLQNILVLIKNLTMLFRNHKYRIFNK